VTLSPENLWGQPFRRKARQFEIERSYTVLTGQMNG
jgi:hypothetical protein